MRDDVVTTCVVQPHIYLGTPCTPERTPQSLPSPSRDEIAWQKEKAERKRKSMRIPETPIVVAQAPKSPLHPDVHGKLTIILTTSPVQSNPSTQMIEEVVGDIAHIAALVSCQKIIVRFCCNRVPSNNNFDVVPYCQYLLILKS